MKQSSELPFSALLDLLWVASCRLGSSWLKHSDLTQQFQCWLKSPNTSDFAEEQHSAQATLAKKRASWGGTAISNQNPAKASRLQHLLRWLWDPWLWNTWGTVRVEGGSRLCWEFTVISKQRHQGYFCSTVPLSQKSPYKNKSCAQVLCMAEVKVEATAAPVYSGRA